MEIKSAILFENVTKSYYLKLKQPRLISLFKKDKIKHNEFLAIDNMTFKIAPGEKVGILGRNGSGKSTLLKLISGVSIPNSGSIEVNGKVGGLIELGAGFHPELTGRENIFVNGAILGLSEKEIKNKLNNIISFSGIDAFIDVPLKHYSSGMKVRLGFSIALAIENDILLLDEVLAVGDSKFRSKALQAMEQYMQGKTIIFISHDLNQIRKICDRCIVIDRGTIKFDGDTEQAISFYKDEILNKKVEFVKKFVDFSLPSIHSAYLNRSKSNEVRDRIAHNGKLEMEINVHPADLKQPKLVLEIRQKDTKYSGIPIINTQFFLQKTSKTVTFKLDNILFYDGVYEIDITLFSGDQVIQTIDEGLIFKVYDTKLDYKLEGIISLPYSVNILGEEEKSKGVNLFQTIEVYKQNKMLNLDIDFSAFEIADIEEFIITLSKFVNGVYIRISHFTVKKNNHIKHNCEIDLSVLTAGKYALGYMMINSSKKLVQRKDELRTFVLQDSQDCSKALLNTKGNFDLV